MTWVIVIRSINALGALFCLFLMLRSANRQWKQWNIKTQQHWWALMGWVALCFEASVETIFVHIAAGPRTVFTTLAVAWTIRALMIDDVVHSASPFKRKDKT